MTRNHHHANETWVAYIKLTFTVDVDSPEFEFHGMPSYEEYCSDSASLHQYYRNPVLKLAQGTNDLDWTGYKYVMGQFDDDVAIP
tara:strand:- start:381 stop:635 length:255 start_codon:yes stop_codon:yes gene_type:complete